MIVKVRTFLKIEDCLDFNQSNFGLVEYITDCINQLNFEPVKYINFNSLNFQEITKFNW